MLSFSLLSIFCFRFSSRFGCFPGEYSLQCRCRGFIICRTLLNIAIRVTNSKDMSTMDPLNSQGILPATMSVITMLVETVVERPGCYIFKVPYMDYGKVMCLVIKYM